MAELKQPDSSETSIPAGEITAGIMESKSKVAAANGDLSSTMPKPSDSAVHDFHPSGKKGYGRTMQIVRAFTFFVYFMTCCLTIFVTQLIGAPLYFFNREWYYAYMALTKRSFAITTTVMTNIWSPTTIRISGDASVAAELRATPDGGVRFDFPERIVLIANHQIYTDWLYLWWVAYANQPTMHGNFYIILKESLKYIPIIGWGMMFYSFIFMSRKMATDQPRLAYRLKKFSQRKTDPNGKSYLDPMWLLLFPEGTNLSGNGRVKSANWAKKNNLKDPEHVMLPRSTGSFFCLNELKSTVEYVYDCTVAYEGIPRGKYGEDYFGLASTFQGRPPKSVNFYWRRFRLADIPLDDATKFDLWIRDLWYEKDALMEEYLTTGRFPATADSKTPYIETAIRTRYPWEILQVFTIVGICGLIYNNVRKLLGTVRGS